MLARTITALALAIVSTAAWAQAWPSKPIKWFVPFAAGGTTDILARTIGEKLSVALGQPVVIENKPGACGAVGAEFTAKSPPDGYTIMGGTISTHAINASLYKQLQDDPVKDFVPLPLIARGAEPVGNTSDEFGVFVKSEVAKWSDVVKKSGAKVD
jgi:tripartite-type tricarboxylate transporter receptor subunit TctC